MSTTSPMTLEPAVAAVLRRVARRRHPLVLVDGPSGAGKTTFAAALVAAWHGAAPRLVRVDEAIPGWAGLRPGAERLERSLLRPHRRSDPGAIHRWDWFGDRPGAIERVRPGGIVVEGCGAHLAGRHRSDAVRVWLDAPAAARRHRALERDGGAFDPYWDAWEADWRRYVLQTDARRASGMRVRLVG
ncbi:ATP-binding protein [Agromyces arachidis]|uniref:ATP-binding protein n=1 Tax=Agromyces arachidis TaxID=766966 RepID=UPI004056DD68